MCRKTSEVYLVKTSNLWKCFKMLSWHVSQNPNIRMWFLTFEMTFKVWKWNVTVWTLQLFSSLHAHVWMGGDLKGELAVLDLSQWGFSHRQGGIRFFWRWRQRFWRGVIQLGFSHRWRSVKILTPCQERTGPFFDALHWASCLFDAHASKFWSHLACVKTPDVTWRPVESVKNGQAFSDEASKFWRRVFCTSETPHGRSCTQERVHRRESCLHPA